MTIEELQAMDDETLQEYFFEKAEYYKGSPRPYAILFGNLHIHSDDTRDLWNKFRKKVRSAKG